MASANWRGARELQERIPHTYTAMEHLIMAMADAYNNKGKKSIFGHDKGLKSHQKFEDKLRDTLLAMAIDGLVSRTDLASIYLEKLLLVLDAWEQIFPNWPDAQIFAQEHLRSNKQDACILISMVSGIKIR